MATCKLSMRISLFPTVLPSTQTYTPTQFANCVLLHCLSSMESLTSLCLSSPSLLFKPHKVTSKTSQTTTHLPHSLSVTSHFNKVSLFVNSLTPKHSLKPHLTLPILLNFLSYSSPLASLASELVEQLADPPAEVSDKINLEQVVLAIDDFINKYPYFFFTVNAIYFIGIPLVEEYLKKYRKISALNAFRKLRDDPSAQLLDIREEKSVKFMASPSFRFYNKNVVQVTFSEGEEDGFVKKVLDSFEDPQNTVLCILDNFDGNSIKVAELLVNNGFKEAYAIRGGLRGEKGWTAIQEELLPPAVHVYPRKKKVKPSDQLNGAADQLNGAVDQLDPDQVQAAASDN